MPLPAKKADVVALADRSLASCCLWHCELDGVGVVTESSHMTHESVAIDLANSLVLLDVPAKKDWVVDPDHTVQAAELCAGRSGR